MPKIKYPRNRIVRGSFQTIARWLMNLLTRPQIDGFEQYPSKGSLIVVANHSGLIETVYMTCFAPRQIEYMGSVDIPHERILAWFMNTYKFIPVYRGNVSVTAMKDGVGVLRQGGVIGIFPEGGIWEPAIRKAHSGVAWMSYHGQAPVLPIGFTPTAGAVGQALSLRRPEIKMRIGETLPPVTIEKGRPKKEQFQDAAQNIMDAVWNLVPADEQSTYPTIFNETFELQVNVFSSSESAVGIPPDLEIKHGSSFSKILYRTTLINNFRDNLRMNIAPLKELDRNPTPDEITEITSQILDYLINENPYYFTYRYGLDEGKQMMKSIQEFHDLAAWADQHNYLIKATPIRKYRREGDDIETIETQPNELDKW